MKNLLRTAVSFAASLASVCLAWDYDAHRAVNQAALSMLPPDFPAFVRTPPAPERIAFLSGEMDRWRNAPDLSLRHGSGPDHYIDIEDLVAYEIKPASLQPFRYDFAASLALFRAAHPGVIPPPTGRNDDHTRELPGFLPWALAEQYAKLKSAFAYLRALQAGGTPEEVANAEANVIYVMGLMGHLAGDSVQPLHTTVHHHGWVGANPRGYTTNGSIHELIDGGFLAATGGVNATKLRGGFRTAQVLPDTGKGLEIFSNVVDVIVKQNQLVEPLYKLEKDGKFSTTGTNTAEGRAFLETQLRTGATLLADLWYSAWKNAPEDTYLKKKLEERKAKAAPAAGK